MKDVPLFQKNQELTSQVLDLTHEGLGVVKIEDYPFFIEGALPGERIEFKAIKIGRKFGYGKLIKILDESPDRVEMKDDKGRLTGTMTLQHLSYPECLPANWSFQPGSSECDPGDGRAMAIPQ